MMKNIYIKSFFTVVSAFLVSATMAQEVPTADDMPADTLDRYGWEVPYVTSDDTDLGAQLGTRAIDGDFTTMYFSAWQDETVEYPLEIVFDMTEKATIKGFVYVPRLDEWGPNGTVLDYEFYVSDDMENWGDPVSSGAFDFPEYTGDNPTEMFIVQEIRLDADAQGQYMKLTALSCVSEPAQLGVNEFYGLGEYGTSTTGINELASKLKVYPSVTSSNINIRSAKTISSLSIVNISGQEVMSPAASSKSVDVSELKNGIYFLQIKADNNTVSKKFIKQ